MKKTNLALGVKPSGVESYSVMVADSSFMDRLLVKRFFIFEKFDVSAEVENGEQVMESLAFMSKKPDILCIHSELSDKTGLDVIKQIRPIYPNMKFVMTAPFADKSLIQELTELNISTLILKPYSKAQICEKMARLLGRLDTLDDTIVEYEKNGINLNEIKIPPMSQVIYKVLSFDSNSPTGGSQELEKIISPDKSLSTAVIRMANSAYYGRSGSIKTLKDAITLLGMKTVKNLVIVHFKRNFIKFHPTDLLKKHLLTVPILASLVAFDLTTPLKLEKLKDEIFIMTLLKKIGSTVLANYFPKPYQEVLKLSEVGVKDVWVLEKESLNINSAELGEKIFSFWKMPDSFKELMHKQYFHKDQITNVTDYDRLARLAELISWRLVGVYQNPTNRELEDVLYAYYKAPAEIKEVFNEDYYEMIQDHPYFQMF